MKIKKSHINVGLLLFILLFTLTGIIYQKDVKPQYILETPKSSADEITIFTPKNKTYTKAISLKIFKNNIPL